MQLLVQSCLFSLAFASTTAPIMKWFKACREKNLQAISEFGPEYLHELHQDCHFEDENDMNDWSFNNKNCYDMILFDYDFRAEKHEGILRRLVELGMPVHDYHFQVATSEEELSFLVDTAEQRGQSLDYPTLLCHSSAGGFLELFKRLRPHVASAQEVGRVENVTWQESWPAGRVAKMNPTTPLLSAVARNQAEMIEYLIFAEGVDVNLSNHPNLLQRCLSNYSPEPTKKTIALLIFAGCSLEPWESLCSKKRDWAYKGAVQKGYDAAIETAVQRRAGLISKLRNGVPSEALLAEGFTQFEIQCCQRAL